MLKIFLPSIFLILLNFSLISEFPTPSLKPSLAFASPPLQNGCGEEGGTDFPDGPWLSWLLSFGLYTPFQDACDNHDICYSIPGSDKGQCDDQFYSDLMDACTGWAVLDPTCSFFAYAYYEAVYYWGHSAYFTATGSEPGGTIISCRASAIDGDELLVVVTMQNRGGASGEYDARLYSMQGDIVDTEPDTYWLDVRSGATAIFTLTTNWDPSWDVFDVGQNWEVNLRLYEPENEKVDSCKGKTPLPKGRILNVSTQNIDDFWGDDEFEACVTFTNSGTTQGEFDIKLYAENGDFIDEEPDGYWSDLDAGEQMEICVGTDGIWPSWSDMGNRFTVTLNEQHLGEMDQHIESLP